MFCSFEDLDSLELQKRLPVVRQALRLAQSNGRERGRLVGLCLPKKVVDPLNNNNNYDNDETIQPSL